MGLLLVETLRIIGVVIARREARPLEGDRPPRLLGRLVAGRLVLLVAVGPVAPRSVALLLDAIHLLIEARDAIHHLLEEDGHSLGAGPLVVLGRLSAGCLLAGHLGRLSAGLLLAGHLGRLSAGRLLAGHLVGLGRNRACRAVVGHLFVLGGGLSAGHRI